jgi:phage baseplate assembly protein W
MKIINKQYPLDLNNRKIIGFGFPLNGNAVFVPTYFTKDQIRANLLNFILTDKGERVFNPHFGTDLKKLLFEQIEDNSLEELTDVIQTAISENFPMIDIIDVSFNNQPDLNEINFNLKYSINTLKITDEINILLQ